MWVEREFLEAPPLGLLKEIVRFRSRHESASRSRGYENGLPLSQRKRLELELSDAAALLKVDVESRAVCVSQPIRSRQAIRTFAGATSKSLVTKALIVF